MTDSGPTTVATIVGKLRMEMEAWKAGVAQIKADAREIGQLNPSIHVSINAGEALAQLEAIERRAAQIGGNTTIGVTTVNRTVTAGTTSTAGADAARAAAERLAAAQTTAASAATRATLAEMRLEEVRSKEGSTARQLLAAELAASEAKDKAAAAAVRAAAAEQRLQDAHQDAGRAATTHAAAEDAVAGSTRRAGDSAGGAMSRFQMLAGAIGLLLPLVSPLSALAVGGAGAFVLMGASGLLAIRGIKAEMEAGTATGKAYSAGLAEMKTDLDGLSQTAAAEMLVSFQKSQGLIRDNFPSLNRQVGIFTGYLGRSGTNLLDGALTSLRVLNPLFERVGSTVERLTRGFASWTKNGGLQQFGDYAIQVLPQVEATLGALFRAVLHIMEALAPLGSVGLAVIQGISETINAIPTPVLTVLAAGATAAYLAFLLWQRVPALIAAVRVGLEMLSAVSIVGMILTLTALANEGGKQLGNLVADTTGMAKAWDALDKAIAKGDLGSASVKENVKQLRGSLDIARGMLGGYLGFILDFSDQAHEMLGWFDWILGPVQGGLTSTFGRTKESLEAYEAAAAAADERSRALATGISVVSPALDEVRDSLGETDGAFVNLNGAMETAIQKQKDYATATAESTEDSSDSWQTYYDGFSFNLDQYLTELQAQVDAQNAWEENMLKLAGRVSQGTLDQLARMGPEGAPLVAALVDGSAEQLSRFAPLAEEGTQAGVDAAVTRIVDGAPVMAAAAAQLGQGAADEIATKLANGTATVQQIVDEYKLTVEGMKPTVQVDVGSAVANVLYLAGQIAGIRSKTVYIDAITRSSDGTVAYSDARDGAAYGGTMGGLANGGSPGFTVRGPGSALSDTAGMWRLADGEEVISNVRGQADGSRGLLKAINSGSVTQKQIVSAIAAPVAGYVSAPRSQPALDTRAIETAVAAAIGRQKPGVTIHDGFHVHNPVPLTEKASTVQGLRRMADELGI